MHVQSKYVLFLDDDLKLHPGTIGALVACMEEDPKVPLQIIVLTSCFHMNLSILPLTF